MNSNAICPNRPSQNEYRKRVPVRLHLISKRQVTNAAFGNGERDRPGCRFRRRAEKSFPKLNGSTNGSGVTPEPARETRALPDLFLLRRFYFNVQVTQLAGLDGGVFRCAVTPALKQKPLNPIQVLFLPLTRESRVLSHCVQSLDLARAVLPNPQCAGEVHQFD
jgi:hypothetical protein